LLQLQERCGFAGQVELDPGYADAYGALAVSYFRGSIWQFDKDPGVLDRAAESLLQKGSLGRIGISAPHEPLTD
jgi:hypothetical protein